MPQIGFVGLGRMGLPICTVLADAGYRVIATDERAGLKEAALASDAAWRDSPAQAAATAGLLITMLPGPRQVHEAAGMLDRQTSS